MVYTSVQICRKCVPSMIKNISRRWISNLEFYEPPYLKNLKPKVPIFEAITVQVKGYDFPPLENFQKFAHNIAEYMNLNVELCWPHPGKKYLIHKYKPYSKITDATYQLTMFERDIKLVNVPATKLPLYSEILQAGLPEGTQLTIMPFDENHYNDRFVPDHDLMAKKKELDELGGPPEEAENDYVW